MSATGDRESAWFKDSGALALMAHLCLYALAGLQVGLACLADAQLQLSPHERDVLVADVMSGIRRVETLAAALAQGILPAELRH
jgi:hypothetical protein